jgi:hypothetical protein
VATKDLAFGQRTIRRILRELDHPEELEHKFAEAILVQAVRNAASKPTPQARMAAANMDVSGATIAPRLSGIPAAEVAIGSEFGSAQYAQFHRSPNPAGYWLYPATRSIEAFAEMDKDLEAMLDDAIAGLL